MRDIPTLSPYRKDNENAQDQDAADNGAAPADRDAAPRNEATPPSSPAAREDMQAPEQEEKKL